MSSQEKSRHDAIVRVIANQRFRFPNQEHPNWRTCVNEPEKTMGIGSTDPIYPDIVVVEGPNNTLVMIGEIETEETVTSEHATQWSDYGSKCGTIYLYDPESALATARSIIGASQIRVAGLRSYSVNQMGELLITNH